MSFDLLGSQESPGAEYCFLIGQEWNCDAEAKRIIFSWFSGTRPTKWAEAMPFAEENGVKSTSGILCPYKLYLFAIHQLILCFMSICNVNDHLSLKLNTDAQLKM